jgi:hypothetical protein
MRAGITTKVNQTLVATIADPPISRALGTAGRQADALGLNEAKQFISAESRTGATSFGRGAFRDRISILDA